MDKILGGVKKATSDPQKVADLGSQLGNIAEAEAANRLNKGNLTQGYDRLNLEASAENRAREREALRGLAQTSYLMGGGAKPLNLQVNSGMMPDFGFGPRPASAAQMQGASTLQGTLLNRLTPQGQIQPTKPDYLNRGTLEKIGSYGGMAAGIGGTIYDMMKG